jgi:dihydrofolate reductase
MSGARLRAYLAVSADGYIADNNGGVHWLEAWDPGDLGFYEFLSDIGALVFGRTTYDQARSFGEWPYGDLPCFVLGQGPGDGFATFSPDPLRLAAEARSVAGDKDVWLVGGGKALGAFLDAGELDTIELTLLPVLLGSGLPLFIDRPGGSLPLRGVAARPLVQGATEIIYRLR